MNGSDLVRAAAMDGFDTIPAKVPVLGHVGFAPDYKSERPASIPASARLVLKKQAPDKRAAFFGGVDPGKKGFLCVVDARGKLIDAARMPLLRGKRDDYDLPSLLATFQLWKDRGVVFVLIEKQDAVRGNGDRGNFSSGFGYGLICMALTAAGIRFQEIEPLKWKTKMGIAIARATPKPRSKAVLSPEELEVAAKERRRKLDARRAEGDKRAVALAQKLFPGVDWRPTEKSEKPSPDKACGSLLAELARRTHGDPG